jgi:hypothetical protein
MSLKILFRSAIATLAVSFIGCVDLADSGGAGGEPGGKADRVGQAERPSDCDDGVPALCTLAEPACPAGSIPALQDGCWTCAEAETCEPLGLPKNCDDGEPAFCTLAEPACPEGSISALQDGCWTCADPFTCEAHGLPLDCNDGPAVCTMPAPECAPGLVAATQAGCWACVDPFTCE